ncbi:autotransporter outer membrane beta-barrel domain-containing protein [Sphingomonas sp. DG1-23]|uniref:autotransporter outer membrane beta-barrel domain-containing protein n=1 Tax=Sphingomonas sp. DG1-23 TaxID=3068316 RepID=UPI0035308E58
MVDVLSSGRLQGTGTIGSARIAGTIAPGNSIGTLTVTGDLSLLSGSVYEVEANVAGESDKITVGGSAAIASGATVRVLAAAGKYGLNTNYTILTAAGGLTGTFSGVTSNLAFLTPSLSYSPTAVTLSLKRNAVDFVSVAQTANQYAIAPAIEALGMGNSVHDAVAALTEAGARGAFDQLAGSDYASMRGQLIEDSRFLRDAMLARTDLAGVEGLSVWGRAIGSWNSMDGNAEAQGYDRSIKGFSTGFDGSLGANWRVGVTLGYTNSELRTGNATHKADSYSAGGHVIGAYGPVRFQLGAAYSWNDVRSQRSVAFGALSQALSDNYDARTFQLFGEVGAKVDIGSLELDPFVGVAHVTLFDGAIAEHGGSAALSGGAEGVKVTYGNIGLRSKLAFDLGETELRLAGSAALRRKIGDLVPVIDLRFGSDQSFQVRGVPLDRTSGVVDAGIELDLGERTTLGVSYTGAYGARTADHGARASVSLRF